MAALDIRLRRAYEPPAEDDGYRILIDRIWPRGVTRDELRIDEWARELAPSTELRKWYGHEPAKFEEFRRRYTEELAAHADALERLRARAAAGRLTIVFGARDIEHSNAAVLARVLRDLAA